MERIAMRKRLGTVAVLLLLGGSNSWAQDHGGQYSQADIQYGAALYTAQCARCHGATGDQIGGVNLRSGQFRRASTDDELRFLLTTGVPGTAMPAFKFDSSEMTGVVAYIRNMRDYDMKSVAIGDAARGQTLFDGKGACAGCHRVNGKGSRKAPNLSDVGSLRPAGALQQSMIDPTGSMLPQNRSIRAVTRDGKVVTGRRLNEDTYNVVLIDEQERLVALAKSDLRQYEVLKTSPMPSYKDKLTAAEMADLLAYLLSLKGPKS
jgi:putative heme-binding domain-containing protein